MNGSLGRVLLAVSIATWFPNALRSASTVRPTRPAGIDRACAQRCNVAVTWWPGRERAAAVILVSPMSIKVTYKNGVFEPLGCVTGVRPGQRYTVFSDNEL